MHIVVASDSFKGSLSAKEVCNTIKKALTSEMEEAQVTVVPMADGGEGTLDALVHATGGKVKEITVRGPLLQAVRARYGIIEQHTAVIETANIIGLPMVPVEQRNPLKASSYGVGEAIRMALHQGYRRFIIGLGGSATNDGGLGMLQALGAVFLNANQEPVQPTAASLSQVVEVDLDSIDTRLFESEILVANDVTNPLCGDQGCSIIFGPQKGATKKQVDFLEQGMRNHARRLEERLGKSLQNQPGAGAAGGLGFALLAIGAKMMNGAKLISESIGLEKKIATAHWVITGEGKTDHQTYYGKLPVYVAKLAQKHGAKALLLSGSIEDGYERLYEYFVSLHSIIRRPMTLEQAMKDAEHLVFETARDLARLINTSVVLNRL